MARDETGRPTATVYVDTRQPSTVEPGFAGYNVALMDVALGYRDPRLAKAALELNVGWLRYPAGTRGEAFDWSTGRSRADWVDQAARTFSEEDRPFFQGMLQSAQAVLDAKGGERVEDAANLMSRIKAKGLIVCLNVLTDTPESAGRFAAYARLNKIPVLAWELGNEPYFNKSRYATGAEYAASVRPFAEAIRAAAPSARIAAPMSDAGFQDRAWDDSLAAYKPRFWNTIVYHHYPVVAGSAAELMRALNGVLLNDTNGYVTREVASRFGRMPVIITEAGPQDGPEPGMSGTAYGGVWSAEYALRMSSQPQVKRFGIHQLLGPAGVGFSSNHRAELLAASKAGKRLDTGKLDFELYPTAQGVEYGAAAEVINSATAVLKTSIQGGGEVPVGKAGSMPALYAQAYRSEGRERVVVTNKSEAAETLALVVNGSPVKSPLDVLAVSGASASTKNTYGEAKVRRRHSRARGMATIPPYSVVVVSW